MSDRCIVKTLAFLPNAAPLRLQIVQISPIDDVADGSPPAAPSHASPRIQAKQLSFLQVALRP